MSRKQNTRQLPVNTPPPGWTPEIARIRELEAGVADALFWFKPGLPAKRPDEFAKSRDDLQALLDKEIAIP